MSEQSAYHGNLDCEESGMGQEAKKVVFYDGDCGLCANVVRFCFHRDRRNQLWYTSLESEFSEKNRVRLKLPSPGADADTFVFWQADLKRCDDRSEAACQLGLALGGIWAVLARISLIVPRKLRDYGYDLIAQNRHRFFRGKSECLLSPELQKRFLK